ncbi:MAG: VWA domain-containing protein [Vicinamibacterales bacterium]
MPKLPAAVVAALACTAALSAQAPAPQQPVFRAGIEILTVDVTALNAEGRQVTDLSAGDFAVEVDGKTRQVASAEYVRLVDPLRIVGAPRPVAAPVDDTFFSSNAKGAPRGRLIVLLVDQGNIRVGSARPSMLSAKKFVDSLSPDDRVAVISIPAPGELVDFTTDLDKVREALLRITGAVSPLRTRFNLSITEAMALYQHNNSQLAAETINRECALASSVTEIERCEREVEQDAAEIIIEVRRRTDDSVRSMREVLRSLGAIEGPKSVILVSEGLILESLGSEADDLATVAADSRVSLDVLLLDVPEFDASQARRPTTPREDRELQVAGLETLAGQSRGTLYRINVSANFAFDRIAHALDGYYLLGVESMPVDRNGQRHRIGVKSTRKGVTIRARRTFLASVSAKGTSPADAVTRALRSPLPINDLPLKISTWTYKEPGTARVRVLVSAEAERLADQSLDYTMGMVLVNRERKGLAPPVELKQLTAKEGDPGTAVYFSALAASPGTYTLRVAMSDSEGRVGSVDRRVDVFQMDGPHFALGDLIVSGVEPTAALALTPVIEPIVTTGHVAALIEMYGPASQVTAAEAVLEILTAEDAKPLAAVPMTVGPGASPEITSAHVSFNASALPPGRYLARSTIRADGKPQGHLIRPFRIAPPAATANSEVPAGVGGALPGEMFSVLLGGLPVFDRKELLTPAMLTPVFAAADGRPTGSKAAVKEARGGQLGAAAMTALGDGDQALAAFLKGLDLLQQSQLDRAAVQFRASMELAPAFAPSRLYLGAAMAEGNRHREAAGLLQSATAAAPTAALSRIAGEEWMKAGQPALAIAPLEQALKLGAPDMRTRKLLGVAYVLGNRAPEAVAVLAPYLETNPTDQPALLAAIFGTYARHLSAPQRETLAADRLSVAKWTQAYAASGGPLPQLVGAWNTYVQGLK